MIETGKVVVRETVTVAVSEKPISTKKKTTPDLNSLFKPTAVATPDKKDEIAVAVINEAVTLEKLTIVWQEFTANRKGQIAEYQLLSREFQYKHPIIEITLTNPVEETLLDNFRRDLTQFLRDHLKNAELNIQAVLQEVAGKKMIYTSKDKFEHLAEKHPYLNELKERLGLDWDF